jgi:outer membrane lipoprotein SlyB
LRSRKSAPPGREGDGRLASRLRLEHHLPDNTFFPQPHPSEHAMKKTILLLASACALASPAFAADPVWLADFTKADLNDSGGLSRVELDKTKSTQLKPVKDNFAGIDTDKDGHATRAEYEAYLARADDRFQAKFKQADLNDSGGLSKTELGKTSATELDVLRKNFDAIDTDRDGHATLAENQAYQKGATVKVATPAIAAKAVDQCQPDCGTVIGIDRYKIEGEGSVVGAIAGGLVGGLLGSQVGGGSGKTVATVGGAAGGAYAGHQIEKRMKTKKMVRITVKFDSGEQQDFHVEGDKSPFPRGARVQVKDGQLVKYAGQ